jgi:hypothetical protein
MRMFQDFRAEGYVESVVAKRQAVCIGLNVYVCVELDVDCYPPWKPVLAGRSFGPDFERQAGGCMKAQKGFEAQTAWCRFQTGTRHLNLMTERLRIEGSA